MVSQYLSTRTPEDLSHMLDRQLDPTCPEKAACPDCPNGHTGGLPCIVCLTRELARAGVPDVILQEAMALHEAPVAHVQRTRRVIFMIREHAMQSHGQRLAKLLAEPPEHV